MLTKRIVIFVLLFLMCAAPRSSGEIVDRILVVVNNEIITQGDVDRILMPVYSEFKKRYTGRELSDKLSKARNDVIDRLLQDKLLLAEAKRKEIEVAPEEVEKKIAETREKFPTEEEFRRTLSREGMTFGELEQKIRERMIIDKLIAVEIRRKVSVSPSEIFAYYNEHKDLFESFSEVKLRSIFVRVSDKRLEEESVKLAKEVLSRLRRGENFALLARQYSDGAYAVYGGDRGWIKEGELMSTINDLIFELEPGEASDILKTKLGLYIFKVEDKKAGELRQLQEAEAEIEQFLLNDKIHEKVTAWIERLRKDAYILFK